jgi:hypothetical protein
MTRTNEQLSYEQRYIDKMKEWADAYKSRTDFASKFKLKPEKTKGYYDTGDPAALIPAGAGATPASGTDGETAGTVSGDNNKEKVWNYFASLKFTEAAVAGVMGNIAVETGDTFNPKILQGGKGPGTGIIQWEDTRTGGSGRWNELLAWAKSKGKDEWDIQTQLDWLWKEMQGRKMTADTYGKMTDVTSATETFEKKVEGAGKPNMPKRIQYAQGYLKKYGKGSSGTAIATSDSSAKSLSFPVTRDIASIRSATTTDTSDLVVTMDFPKEADLIVHAPMGKIRGGRYVPPTVSRIGYVANRLYNAKQNQWKGWASIDNTRFIHLGGVQENLYAPEAQIAFSILYDNLRKDKIKVIQGFQPNKKENVWSMHNVGMAIDIYVDNIYDAIYVADTAWYTGFRAIAIGGDKLDGTNPGFVHIDTGPQGYWPLNHHDTYKGPQTFNIVAR